MGLTTNLVRGERGDALMLLIHGLGADERDLAGLLPHLDPDGRFICVLPRGPYAAPPGYAWFRFDSPSLMASTIASSLDAVDEVLDEACDVHGYAREDTLVGGFSQGCALALALVFRAGGRPRPKAVLGLSGFLPPEEAVTYDWDAPDAPPVLLQHGTDDPLISIDRARASAETLSAHGVPVKFETYRMEHQASLESMGAAREWLDRVMGGERPSEDVAAAPLVETGPVRPVTSSTFDAEVLRSDKPVIVDFWAPWCQPCKAVAPVVEQIAIMRNGSYKVVKVNVDECPDIAQRYDVRSIPMVALFRGGRMERKSVGAKPRPQLEAELGMLVIP